MDEQLHREIFEKLKKSVPGLKWDFRENHEGSALITAFFVVYRFDDNNQEIHPAVRICIIKNGNRCHYSVGFMNVVEGFTTHEYFDNSLLRRLNRELPDLFFWRGNRPA